jgi:hypothetical protein
MDVHMVEEAGHTLADFQHIADMSNNSYHCNRGVDNWEKAFSEY